MLLKPGSVLQDALPKRSSKGTQGDPVHCRRDRQPRQSTAFAFSQQTHYAHQLCGVLARAVDGVKSHFWSCCC